MTSGGIGIGFIVVLMVMGPFSLAATGAENTPDVSSNLDAARLTQRMDRLENRVTDLETQVITLKREKAEAQENLKRQEETNTALKSRIEQQTRPATEEVSSREAVHQSSHEGSIDPRDEGSRHNLISSYGVRLGYQGFPFGQREGGFFYGAYLDHLLMAQEEGMPAGDLDLELGAGVAFSGTDKTTVNSEVVGEPTVVDFRQRMISIWPDLKYRYNRWKSYGLTPYLTGGPGIWVDIIETPPLVGGLQFSSNELGARKLPAIAGAGLFEGAQGGAGFEFSLARLHYPIFERMKLGFDYRYSAWTTGGRFSTYSLLLTYRDE